MAIVKSEVRCETPRCVADIAKWGEHYHSVHDKEQDGISYQRCERCGGARHDGKWQHKCKSCGVDVAPGELRGFFVPHRCQACDDKVVAQQKAAGDICRRCHTVTAYCCC